LTLHGIFHAVFYWSVIVSLPFIPEIQPVVWIAGLIASYCIPLSLFLSTVFVISLDFGLAARALCT
jgi:hypothetical protein